MSQPTSVGPHLNDKTTADARSLLPVVILANLSHSHQGLQVLIGLVRVDVVQGTAVPGVSVRGREIYSYLKRKTRRIGRVESSALLRSHDYPGERPGFR